MTTALTTPSTQAAIVKTSTLGLMAGTLAALGIIDGGGGGVWTDVLASFGVGESTLGPALAVQSAFVFPVLLLGGVLLRNVGFRAMLVVGAVLLALASFAYTGLEGLAFFIALFAIRGVGLALLDFSGNTMAMHIERETGKHIMGIVHGGFSIGIIVGSLLAFTIYALDGSFRMIHGLLGLILLLVAVGGLLGPVPQADAADVPQNLSLAAFRTPMVRICAIAMGLAFGGEILISQFVSVLLRTRIEASETMGVLAVVAYASMMAVGRFSNGPLLERFDPTTLLLAQGVGLGIGGAIVALAPNVPITLLGSVIGGLGVAGIVPTVLSYAATHSESSAGVTTSATLLGGYGGALLLPLFAGGLTSLFSIRAGVGLAALAGVLTVACALSLRKDEITTYRFGTVITTKQ